MHYKQGHCQTSGVQHWSFSMPQLCQTAIDLHFYFIFHVEQPVEQFIVIYMFGRHNTILTTPIISCQE
jgi:hypothetical protein